MPFLVAFFVILFFAVEFSLAKFPLLMIFLGILLLQVPIGDKIRLRVGDEASLSRTFSDQDVQAFAVLSGDTNPLHTDATVAKDARFHGKQIVHGILTASLFSTIFGTHLPGAIYVSQTLKFKAPVYLGDTVVARVRIKDIRAARKIVTCETDVRNQDDTLVITGDAQVILPLLDFTDDGFCSGN